MDSVCRNHKAQLEKKVAFLKSKLEQTALDTNKQKSMTDVALRYKYEITVLMLNILNSDYQKYYQLFTSGDSPESRHKWRYIRERACFLASGGRTVYVIELRDNEIINAKKYANSMIDKSMSEFIKTAV